MPMPVMKRSATSICNDVAQAENSENRPNSATESSSTGLRPKRSATGPASMAPTMMPTLESAKAWVKAAGGSDHALVSDGTASPMAERS
jgi:hypothetical protein